MSHVEMTSEVAGLLSSIWVIASNDENPIITYRSIRKRLGLDENYPLEHLIKSKGELFRLGAPNWRLDEWKHVLRQGGQIPSWFHDHPKESWPKLIESIDSSRVFRSQFRINRSVEKSPVEVIEWGLQHIERLRKSHVESSELKWKWMREGLVPIVSLVIAFGTLALTSYFQYENIQVQKQLKEYELSFKPKQEGYANFMQSLDFALDVAGKISRSTATSKDYEALSGQLQKINIAYYAIEPFLDGTTRQEISDKKNDFGYLLIDISESGRLSQGTAEKAERIKKVMDFQHFFSNRLKSVLFSQ